MNTPDWLRRVPWSILVAAGALAVAGAIGIARCEELAGGSGRFLYQHLLYLAVATAAMLAAAAANYRILYRWSYAIFALAVAMLAAVYLFPAVNGAHRWIRVGSIGIQPSELAKLALVLALARYLMYRDSHRRMRGLLLPIAMAVVPALLILKEPDLGTSLLFLPVLAIMLFVAGARRGDLVRLVLIGIVLAPVLWTQMSRQQRSRVTALFEQTVPGEKPHDDAYQLHQAKQMLALGGVWGSAVAGQSVQDPAAYYLPEARSDFIFCVVGERFGLWGLAILMGLYGVLLWRGQAIAAETREPFGRLVAAGLTGLLAVQVLVNTGMNVGLLPVTGVSLPLVSYGGSGLLTYGLALGLLVNIALHPGYELSREPFRFVEAGSEQWAVGSRQ